MPSKPFLPPAILQRVIPALNQGEVTFTRKDGAQASTEMYELDENGILLEAQPAIAPATWTSAALFDHGRSALIDGQWQSVTMLTLPVPLTDYEIQHGDVVTWDGAVGRVVKIKPTGTSDQPGGYEVGVAVT